MIITGSIDEEHLQNLSLVLQRLEQQGLRAHLENCEFNIRLGAVLSHIFEDGTEHPIVFASRSLTNPETGYSQIDKESMSIYLGVQNFHTYLFGRRFTLISDHKPLVSIFHPKKSLTAMTTARLQRQALFLFSHNYSIEYRKTAQHGNADGLSRLPLALSNTDSTKENVDTVMNCVIMNHSWKAYLCHVTV